MQWKTSTALLYFAIIGVVSSYNNEEHVISGCGGFIKISDQLQSSNKQQLDYSAIKVMLVTSEGGAVKDSTECAPTGYYFLPIYDKQGSFIIKIEGPPGWTFEPQEAQVSIGENNKCISKNKQQQQQKGADHEEDINFSLTGFSIFGKVTEKCEEQQIDVVDAVVANEGLAGITISLLQPATSSNPLQRVETSSKGLYTFTNVFPGQYQLKASHNSWTLSKDFSQVVVEWGNVNITEDFIVSGYDLSGRVASHGDEPVLGVDFLLYSDTVKSVPCTATNINIPDSRSAPPLCVARSDETGKFLFKNIPCGKYSLVPFYRGANTTFDVVPPEIAVTVSRGSTILKEPFQVMGFSLNGKVVNNEGKGIKDVAIKVDGKQKCVTDSNGYYKLDQLVSGTYDIEAVKEHFTFNSLTKYRLSPNVVSLPDITVKSYHLCGRIYTSQTPSGVNIAYPRVMLLLTEDDKEVGRQNTDQSGNFCFEVPAGTYKVSPFLTSTEEAAGLLLNPRSLKVSIASNPILDLSFNQARVTISGRVKCIETPCDPSISVSLYSESNQNRVTTGLGVRGTTGRDGDDSDYFVFRDVFPGTHRVSIHKDSWCWEHDSFEAQVKTEDITNLEFLQTGYLLTLKLSHEATLLIDLENKEEGEFKNFSLPKGSHKFCIKKPGIHSIQPSSCFKFEQDVYKYDTSAPKVIDMTAHHYLVHGQIEASYHPSDFNSQQADISITIHKNKKEDNQDTETISPVLVTSSNNNTKFVYEYTYWAKLGDNLEIIPSSSKLLFYPPSQTVSISKPECPHVDIFEARLGLFLRGSTSPPLPNVKITAYEESGTQKLKEVLTQANGNYEIGPFYDTKKYRVTAEKEGFNFQQTNDGMFKAIKLCSISVTVTDSEQQGPVPGVLLSLSGANYRNNSVTQQQGSFVFFNLLPGEYYLKPLLKEYQFVPSSPTIALKDGEDKDVAIAAKRIAYSCYGNLRSLNGEPEKMVTIEAIGTKGEYEETQTDSNGQFRLRGLLPNYQYRVRVKQGETDKIERASPTVYMLNTTNKDTHDLEFVVFRYTNKYDVTGLVTTTDEKWLNSLSVVLYKSDAPTTPVTSIPLGNSGFFEFSGLTKGKYTVKVQSTLSPQKYKFNTPETVVDLDSQPYHTHIRLNFTVTSDNIAHEITAAPMLGFTFAVIILLGVFYYQNVLDFIQSARNPNRKRVSSETDSASEWLPANIVGPKAKKVSNPKNSNKK